MSEKEKYHYQVVEKSLTQGFLLKFLWNPIVARIPARITPNSITVCGAGFMLFGGLMVWLATQGHAWTYLLAALCVFLYMTCDNVDGPHARGTKQSSRLGEFLDHWFDANTMIVINMGIVFSLAYDGWLLVAMGVMVTLAFFTTIWEHAHTGIFQSGRMGTNEGLILVIALYLLLGFVPRHPRIQYAGPEHLSLASCMLWFSLLVCSVTLVKSILRVREHLHQFLPLLGVIVGFCVLPLAGLDKRAAVAGIFLGNLIFSGPFLIRRLTGKSSQARNWIFPGAALLLAALVFAAPEHARSLATARCFVPAFVALLLAPALWDLGRAVKYLRKPQSASE